MHPNRRRKKRPNYGLRTVEVSRGSNGFGFTISGQQPCILSCIVGKSPAERAGLRAGDFLISVNGISVSKMAHEAVVSLIGNCVGPIQMTIAENYYSDSSSDGEFETNRIIGRKPKYMHHNNNNNNNHKLRPTTTTKSQNHHHHHHHHAVVEPNPKNLIKFHEQIIKNDQSNNKGVSIEYKVLVGYLGTIEMPKPLLPNSRFQTVCSCIRKLRQEKRTPTNVLMTILPNCLTLTNVNGDIIAIYPATRVIYIGTSVEKDCKFFGLFTSAAAAAEPGEQAENEEEITISNSCHVFMIESKFIEHRFHLNQAETFHINCTADPVTQCCLEFPQDASYVVNLIQTMYKLPSSSSSNNKENNANNNNNKDAVLLIANSPQPSASSNSDSGIGYRDDCGNISDRILVVEFPAFRPSLISNNFHHNRHHGIDEADLLLEFPLHEENNNPVPEDNVKLFRVPVVQLKRKSKKVILGSCDNIEEKVENNKSNYYYTSSCDNLENIKLYEDENNKFALFGSLQDLPGWNNNNNNNMTKKSPNNNTTTIIRKICAQSAPDVRIDPDFLCDQNGTNNNNNNNNNGTSSGNNATNKITNNSSSCGPNSWSNSFEKLLEDPVGLHAFAEFLKKEFSAENIYFWTACERYRKLTEETDRRHEAMRIFERHISAGALEAVNVDAQGVFAAESGLNQAGCEIFDTAQKQIFNLMKFDSYPRFLKSSLYRDQYLKNDNDDGWHNNVQFDARLELKNLPSQNQSPTNNNNNNNNNKLKKSLSNAEDHRRRKSLLPWHRKTSTTINLNQQKTQENKAEIHSSHSSLTSLDLAIGQDIPEVRPSLCRILLANGSTTVVQIKDNETVKSLVDRLLEKRGFIYSSYEVFTNKHPKCLDVTTSSVQLAGCEVTVEQRVVFKLDLPNKKIISVKSKYTKLIVDVLRPILHKYKFSLDDVLVTRAGQNVDLILSVISIDNARLNVQLKEKETVIVELNNVAQPQKKLEEITNRVFEGILQEKCDVETLNNNKKKSDKGSVKSEDWGSEHSSGLLGRFLRRDSAIIQEKKKKTNNCARSKLLPLPNDELLLLDQKKPLIAKLKAGTSKLHVAATTTTTTLNYSESDELVEGLTRAQRRLEDQRGTEINFELPDFLKHKAAADAEAATKMLKKNPPPPPLPPKPKIVPLKPPNWGQQQQQQQQQQTAAFYKTTTKSLDKLTTAEMFLEQTSGSFV